jgi:hypothetical protein
VKVEIKKLKKKILGVSIAKSDLLLFLAIFMYYLVALCSKNIER